MYQIPLEFVASWAKSGTRIPKLPHSVDIICPHCGRQVNFTTIGWEKAKAINASFCTSKCPGCREGSSFIWIGEHIGESSEDDNYELYIHPSPRLMRRPIEGLDTVSDFPIELKNAYTSAINVFNVRQWTAAAVLCGRVLEGLAQHRLPEKKQKLTLNKLLHELSVQVDFKQPIIDLTDGIRKGRNIGAHFDARIEPDQGATELMMDLLDYFIEYVYVLPGRIEKLHNKLTPPDANDL